ncbi:MAG: hypothetical protein ACOYXB_08005 [Bacteroidota bacterium]
MKKTILSLLLLLSLNGCGIIRNLSALSECEYRFHSARSPVVAGLDMSHVNSFSDLSFLDGSVILASILGGTLPFSITANIEVINPGNIKANVDQLSWIALIDNTEVARGTIGEHYELAPGGGRVIIPVKVEADLFDYLEGDNPRTMLNFALNLADAGGEPTRLSLKIKPSVRIGKKAIKVPGYFRIDTEFSSAK